MLICDIIRTKTSHSCHSELPRVSLHSLIRQEVLLIINIQNMTGERILTILTANKT